MRLLIAEEKQREAGVRVPLTKKQRVKKTLNILAQLVFAAVFMVLVFSLVSIYIAKSKGEVPRILGAYSLFVVESGSMDPTLTVGCVILSKQPKDANALKVGDIVTFNTESGYVVTHRIIEIINGDTVKYLTKGDNPVNSPDEDLLVPERVIGVFVMKIPLT
jgi:signal peptidase